MSDWYCEELLSGKIRVDVVVETEHVIAFHHTRPYYELHLVVVPKRHVEDLLALRGEDEPLLLELLEVVQEAVRVVAQQVGGAHVVTNIGKYQESKHLHVHVGGGTPRDAGP